MSMLSDYQRMVEKPRLHSLEHTIKVLRAENGALTSALAREWRPIATAPQNGTPILVWPVQAEYGLPGEGRMVYVARWEASKNAWIEAAGEQYEHLQPTHWMPLPAPAELRESQGVKDA